VVWKITLNYKLSRQRLPTDRLDWILWDCW